jgi:hypothetical protein
MKRNAWIVAVAMATLAGIAEAKPAWVKKAQAEDSSIKNCLACHTAIKVTKEDPKLNGRGQFLVDKQKELEAKEIELKWLKDYKEKK